MVEVSWEASWGEVDASETGRWDLTEALVDDGYVHDRVLLVGGLQDGIVGEILHRAGLRAGQQPRRHKVVDHSLVVHDVFTHVAWH